MEKKSPSKSSKPTEYSLDFIMEQLARIEKESKQWVNKHGFNTALFEREIKSLTLKYPDVTLFFWGAARNGLLTYLLVKDKIKKQQRNTKNKIWLKSRLRQIVTLYRNIQDAIKSGLIEPVNIHIKPIVSDEPIFESDPYKHKNFGKPVNTLATIMALDLVHACGLSESEASDFVEKFIITYLPNEDIRKENIRLSLYRKKHPSLIHPPSVQKGSKK